jgi:hypothetical protein
VESVLQRPFQNVAEWLGEEGEKFRAQWRMRQISEAFKTDWLTFAAECPSLSESEIDAELTAIDEAPKPLPMRRRGRQKRDRSVIGAPLQ